MDVYIALTNGVSFAEHVGHGPEALGGRVGRRRRVLAQRAALVRIEFLVDGERLAEVLQRLVAVLLRTVEVLVERAAAQVDFCAAK